MQRKILLLLYLALIITCSGCVSIFRYDGPYEGKVMDADTKQPLEGVVVLGIWNKVYGNVAGSSSEFYDSVEIISQLSQLV